MIDFDPLFFPPYLREGFWGYLKMLIFVPMKNLGPVFYAIKAGATFEVVYLGHLSIKMI